MNNRIVIGPRPIAPGGQPGPVQPQKPQSTPQTDSFQQALDKALLLPVKFSGHAQDRLAETGRKLTDAELQGIAKAVDRAAQKGSRDTLLLMRDLALVVSVKNRTVITAVEGERMKENIFTNIDSAVLL